MTTVLAIEGPDYVGKTTLARRLLILLNDRNIPTRVHSHAPPPAGAGPWRTALHFACERARIAEEIAADAVTQVHIIDRWFTSAGVRMNAMLEMRRRHGTAVPDESACEQLHGAEIDALPHVEMVILDAPDAVLDARAAMRGEVRTELERAEARIYRHVLRSLPGRRIDASGTLDDTAAAVLRAVGLR